MEKKATYLDIRRIFSEFQEEGYYTFGLDKDSIPEKVTINQSDNKIIYSKIYPTIKSVMEALKKAGFNVVVHIKLGAPIFIGSKTIGDKKKILYDMDSIPTTLDLKKYTEKPKATLYYTPPPKDFFIYEIDVFIDPPKTLGQKVKKFLDI